MKKNCHPNYLTAGHTIWTLLKSGATIKWPDGTEIEVVPGLNTMIVKAREYGIVRTWLHFPVTMEGTNKALDELAEWRRDHAKR